MKKIFRKLKIFFIIVQDKLPQHIHFPLRQFIAGRIFY